jgi:hypothetical protein
MDSPKVELGLLRDFPEFLGPMVVKELREGMRARRFVLPFLLVHLLMLVALFSDLASIEVGSGFSLFMVGYGGIQGLAEFWKMASLMLLVVIPLGGIGALQKESAGGNVELLLMTGQSRWKIVGGQWLVMFAQGSFILLTMVPYLLVRYFMIGGIDLLMVGTVVFCLLCLHGIANAFAIALSGYANLLKRILLGFFLFWAAVITVMAIIGSAGAMMSGMGSYEFGVGAALAITGGTLTAMIYLVVLFLQIGRARIRLFERSYEVSQSVGIVIMVIVSPFMMGFVGIATMGWGVVPLALLLSWGLFCNDRGMKGNDTPTPPSWS